jgi:hypothetical protein
MQNKILKKDSYKRTEIHGIKYYGKHYMLTGKSCNENILSIDII